MPLLRTVITAICLTLIGHQAVAGSHWRPTPAQQEVLKSTKVETKYVLAILINSVGFKCIPVSYRRLGLNPQTGELVYIERCQEDEYLVSLERDEGATGRILACPLLKLVSNVSCNALQPAHFINPFPLR